jgi:hypothetical protein
MIPKECKRVAEVDFRIDVVTKWAAKEKSIPVRTSIDAASVVGLAG